MALRFASISTSLLLCAGLSCEGLAFNGPDTQSAKAAIGRLRTEAALRYIACNPGPPSGVTGFGGLNQVVCLESENESMQVLKSDVDACSRNISYVPCQANGFTGFLLTQAVLACHIKTVACLGENAWETGDPFQGSLLNLAGGDVFYYGCF